MPSLCHGRDCDSSENEVSAVRMPSLFMDMALTHLEIGFEKGRNRNKKEDKTI
jgi:hypothetical protein